MGDLRRAEQPTAWRREECDMGDDVASAWPVAVKAADPAAAACFPCNVVVAPTVGGASMGSPAKLRVAQNSAGLRTEPCSLGCAMTTLLWCDNATGTAVSASNDGRRLVLRDCVQPMADSNKT